MRVRRRYHTRSAGLVYIFITLLIALGAFNSQNNLLFWGFGLSISILLVSGVLSGSMLMGIVAERGAPVSPSGSPRVGEPLIVPYRVRNRGFIPAFGLRIDETGPGRPLSVNAEPPGDRAAFVVHVGPREVVLPEGSLTAPRRGLLVLPAFRLFTTFPFGLVGKSIEFPQQTRVLIRPRRLSLARSVLQASAGSMGSGLRRARAGEGDEFHALRTYRPGDDWRGIAWRASARSSDLLVREQASPVPRRTWIVLLLGAKSSDELDEDAIALAAAAAERAAEDGEVGLAVPAAGLVRPPRPGRRHIELILDDLAALDLPTLAPARAGPADAVPTAVLGRRAACIVVHAGEESESASPPSFTTLHASRLVSYLTTAGAAQESRPRVRSRREAAA